MKSVDIPIVDGKYQVVFPEKCVYCGAPKEVDETVLASRKQTPRRTAYVTVTVLYCTQHYRAARRNARILVAAFVSLFLFSCCVLFSITTSIKRDPPVGLMVGLGVVALGLAYGGKLLLRRALSRSIPTMGDMMRGDNLGLAIVPGYEDITFTFTNDQIAEEFARLNGQSVKEW